MAAFEIPDLVVRDFLDRKLDLIRREYAPLHFVVFGSRAEGRAREDSDIDVIIVSERFRDIRFGNRMGHFLNTVEPQVAVDALCYTPEEFEIMLRKRSAFIRDAVANGIEVA